MNGASRVRAAGVLATMMLAVAPGAASADGIAVLDAIFLPSDLTAPQGVGATYDARALDAANDVLVTVSADRTHLDFTDPGTLVVGNPLLRCLGTIGKGGCTTEGAFVGYQLHLGGGDDRARSQSFADVGDDLNGDAGNDQLFGGPGRSGLTGGDGDDLLRGGAGDDSLGPGVGADDFGGGSGRDAVVFAPIDSSVTVTVDGVADDGSPGQGANVRTDVEEVWADRGIPDRGAPRFDPPGGDLIVGSPAANLLRTSNGPATVHGLGGDDWIVVVETSSATLSGGDGDDRIDDIGGPSSISCGPGFDRVRAGSEDTVGADCEAVTIVD